MTSKTTVKALPQSSFVRDESTGYTMIGSTPSQERDSSKISSVPRKYEENGHPTFPINSFKDLTLAGKDYNCFSSESSYVTEDIHSKREPTATSSKFERTVLKAVSMIVQQNNEADKVAVKATEDLADTLKIYVRRLDTMVATQPPYFPIVAQPQEHPRLISELLGHKLLKMGVQSKLFGGRSGAMPKPYSDLSKPSKDLRQPTRGKFPPKTDPKQFSALQNGLRDKFYPIKARIRPMTMDEMYYILKADETRYHSAIMASVVQRGFGGLEERLKASRYPLLDRLNRKRKDRRKKEEKAMQKENTPPTNALGTSVVDKKILGAIGDRKFSWAMEEDRDYDNQRSLRKSLASKASNGRGGLNNNTWTENLGIRFSNPFQTNQNTAIDKMTHPKPEICFHYSQGHCKFGDKCNKSHDLKTIPNNTGPVSIEAEKLNSQLSALLEVLVKAKGMTYNELRYNNLVELVKLLNNNSEKLTHSIIWSTGEEISQSHFKSSTVQSMEEMLNIWWSRIAMGVAKPSNLFDATANIGKMINLANTKMSEFNSFGNKDNFSQINHFQDGPQDAIESLAQELIKKKHQHHDTISNQNRAHKNRRGDDWGAFNGLGKL
ncbi:hypothetical protein GQ44DRAFT_806721 [Phaeosphaeriaceae sp. PMI808]|nr:hypothetical protein GQ44DRAFT_806721 [Phaeosphaeriaceae sp. PMI808]